MTTNQIRYISGKPDRYISTRTFQLGDTGQSMWEGMDVLFDGTNVELNGSKFVLPTLRGAIKLGWLVREDCYNPDDAPSAVISANIGVRSANDLGQNPLSPVKRSAIVTVETDERVVMSHKQRTQQANQQTRDVRASQGRGGARDGGPDVGGSEFGVELQRTFQTPAKMSLELNPNNVGGAIRQADLVQIQPGQGVTEEGLVSQMDDEQRAQYLADKEARKADVLTRTRTQGYTPPPAVTTNLASHNQPGGKRPGGTTKASGIANSSSVRVGRVVSTPGKTTEGISVSMSVGGGTEVFDAAGTNQKALESSVTAEGISFRNTNGPKKDFPVVFQGGQDSVQVSSVSQSSPVRQEEVQSRIDRDGTAEFRRRIAKELCQDFPEDYNFSDHWKRRLAMIRLNFESRVDVIRAIFAAESDDFKRTILEEFPDAFQS
jgi:hypothetical protein